MIFQRVNRTNAERVFVVMKANVANIAADDVVALDVTAGNADGVNIVQPTSLLNAVVGVADAAIANGSYGLVQVYGYRSTSRIRTTSSLAAGFHLIPIVETDDLGPLDATGYSAVNASPGFMLMESASAAQGSSTLSAKIFIRQM